MARIITTGVTTMLAVALACAPLPGSATTPQQPASPTLASASTGDGAAPDRSFGPDARARALEAAGENASTVAASLGLGTSERLHVTDVERDADGTLHVRYSRTVGGLPVLGGDFVVHESPSGAIEDADFATSRALVLATDVETEVSALRAARLSVKAAGVVVGEARKIVWAVAGTPRLSWLSKVSGEDARGFPTYRAVVIDAATGRRIQSWDLREEADGRGRSLYSGTVSVKTIKKRGTFLLKDNRRGGSRTVDVHNKIDRRHSRVRGTTFSDQNNVWGSGSESNRQSAAVDAAYGAALTWDYYLKSFRRKGIRNNGHGARSRVHYDSNYDNAFWSDGCFCITYGDGGRTFTPLVSRDVAGHEMSHGVTSATAGLNYFGDAGGLNEATSDIFGSMVEFSAHSRAHPGNYFIGEQIMRPGRGRYLRRMDNPALDGRSFNCWSPEIGSQDPHYTSGPANHFYYLLAEGSGVKRIGGLRHNSPTCHGAPGVSGIGRTKAAQIWYRALTRYFVSTTRYPGARDATIRAAVDLYGRNSGACAQVVKAWNAVAVPRQSWTCTR